MERSKRLKIRDQLRTLTRDIKFHRVGIEVGLIEEPGGVCLYAIRSPEVKAMKEEVNPAMRVLQKFVAEAKGIISKESGEAVTTLTFPRPRPHQDHRAPRFKRYEGDAWVIRVDAHEPK